MVGVASEINLQNFILGQILEIPNIDMEQAYIISTEVMYISQDFVDSIRQVSAQ